MTTTLKTPRARRAPLWTALLLFGACLVPSALLVRRAFADDEDDAPQSGEAMSSDDLSKKRRAVLGAMAADDTVLINVTAREMPASPDVMNLGRKGTRALSRCVSDNVDDALRARCAQLLGRLGDRGGLAALQGALEAWSPEVRRAAIEALRRMPDATSVAPLAKLLEREDEEASNRDAALVALGAMSDARAVTLLRRFLHDPPEKAIDLQVAAFKGLWKSRHLVPRKALIAEVSFALSSGDAPLVLPATFAASELRAPELSAPLTGLMKHADTRIRNRAVYALGKIGDKHATKALLEEVPQVRESRMLNNLAFALERLDSASFYRTAQDLITHKQAQIRMNAAFVLGDVRRPEGLPLLEGALSDKNDTVRLSAVRALGQLDARQAASVLERYVDDPNPSLKKAAIYAIYNLSGDTRTDLVHDKLYALPEPATRLEAAIALGRANDPRVTGDLLACLELRTCGLGDVEGFLRASKSPEVAGRTLLAWAQGRSELTDLVASLKPPAAGVLARSEVQASLAHRNVTRASYAIDLSGDVSAADAVLVLTPLLSHENTRLRLHAAVALARAGQTDADAVLLHDLDNLPHEQLAWLARMLSRIVEPAARARLTPELLKRESGSDVPAALAAAAVRLEWDPEAAIFRFLAALAAPSRLERDLAERYLLANPKPIVTQLLRRALARETSASVSDQLRRILDLRTDRDRAR